MSRQLAFRKVEMLYLCGGNLEPKCRDAYSGVSSASGFVKMRHFVSCS